MQQVSKPGITPGHLLRAWGNILRGSAPMLSIEITRECPLHCPGCYAYGEDHLGGGVTLRELRDYRGDQLVDGVMALVRKHRPLHVSLVGGEPLVRHRELSRILPQLSALGIFTMVVTSAVIPIPGEWMGLPHLTVAVSVDGLPEDHDVRRAPATYERILMNIAGRRINIHWTITRPAALRENYAEEYVSFWNSRPEVDRIWVSVYTPQRGESAPEILMPEDRQAIVRQLAPLRARNPKLLFNDLIGRALLEPPKSPGECLFAKFSVNYSADFRTQVEPCVFGGQPDCSQCGCVASTGLHGLQPVRVAGPVTIGHLARGSVAIGAFVNRLRRAHSKPARWNSRAVPHRDSDLVQIGS
jgi:organic radical activating enzyme